MTEGDIHPPGFAGRAPLPAAWAWIDAHAAALGPETVEVDAAAGRILAAPCVSQADWPNLDTAATDGYAMRAADSEGASSYNPLLLTLLETKHPGALPPGRAALVVAGAPLPSGADAILPFDAAQRSGAVLEVLAAVARGTGVDRRGSELRAGTRTMPATRRLRPQDVALFAATGVARLSVASRPRVGLVVAGPKAGGHDALTPMLRALVGRDGGGIEVSPPSDALRWRER